MKKRFVDKKWELFREYFPEHKVSEKGSIYTTLQELKQPKEIIINSLCVTKGTIDKIGEKRNFSLDMSTRLLLTPNGKLMVASPGGIRRFVTASRFSPVGMKDLHNLIPESQHTGMSKLNGGSTKVKEIAQIFLVGKKYEWILHYPKLWCMPYFRSFNSLTAAKNYIGYTFISTDQFSHLFKSRDALQRLIEAKTHEQRVAVVQFLDDSRSTDTLNDIFRLCAELKIGMVPIPTSKIELNAVHDSLVERLALAGADKYPATTVEYSSESFDIWKEKGIEFDILDSPRRLYIEGQKQSHCLGSYGSTLKNNIFVSFLWEDRTYDCMFNLNGRIDQFYGKRNCNPPKELRSLIQETVKPFRVENSEEYDKRGTIRPTPYHVQDPVQAALADLF